MSDLGLTVIDLNSRDQLQAIRIHFHPPCPREVDFRSCFQKLVMDGIVGKIQMLDHSRDAGEQRM